LPVSVLTYGGEKTFCRTEKDVHAERTEVRTGLVHPECGRGAADESGSDFPARFLTKPLK
jgi:hypothetical protein